MSDHRTPPTDGPRLREVSEEELLARVFPLYAEAPGRPGDVLVGPGDDAAVLAAASGSVVATTDTMVIGLDWLDAWSSPAEVGAKLVTQNVADVAAMGARPTGLLVTLAAHPDLPVAWAEDFARGIARQADAYDVSVVGGDLSGAPEGVVMVSITALGDLEGRDPVLRSGARPGDVVAVHGGLGRSGAGWWLHEQGADPDGGDLAARLMAWHRVPVTSVAAGAEASRGGATAMMDVSDGLVRDAGRIARASGVRIDLDAAALSGLVDALAEAVPQEVAWRQVLTGGEEHSLVATFPEGAAPLAGSAWRTVGRVLPEEGGPAVTLDGAPTSAQGWDHFAG